LREHHLARDAVGVEIAPTGVGIGQSVGELGVADARATRRRSR
jgi:hypothetical protein